MVHFMRMWVMGTEKDLLVLKVDKMEMEIVS